MSDAEQPVHGADCDCGKIVLHGEQGERLMQQLESAARFVLAHIPPLALYDSEPPVTLRLASPFFIIMRGQSPFRHCSLSAPDSVTISLNGALLAPFLLSGYRYVLTHGVLTGIEPTLETLTPTQHLQCLLMGLMPMWHEIVCLRAMGKDTYKTMFATQNADLFRMYALGARLNDDQPLLIATATMPIRTLQDFFPADADALQ